MQQMINKELLSEVLKVTVLNLSDEYDNNLIPYEIPIDGWCTINIYELAHKCKKWAFKQQIGKTDTYYNGCGRGQQHKMYEINIITKYCHNEYFATIDNGKDLNCPLYFYGLTAKHNSSVKEFEYKAQTVKDICFYAGTEPEAIFKACQWVLDSKDNK